MPFMFLLYLSFALFYKRYLCSDRSVAYSTLATPPSNENAHVYITCTHYSAGRCTIPYNKDILCYANQQVSMLDAGLPSLTTSKLQVTQSLSLADTS